MSLGEQVFEVAERFYGDVSADVVRQERLDSPLKVVDRVCADEKAVDVVGVLVEQPVGGPVGTLTQLEQLRDEKGRGTSHTDPKDAVVAGPKGTDLHQVVVHEHALQTPSLTRYEVVVGRNPNRPFASPSSQQLWNHQVHLVDLVAVASQPDPGLRVRIIVGEARTQHRLVDRR